MSRAVYEERQVKKLKELLTWAKTFIFKNQEIANRYETPDSIELSNYYISCRNDTLPYIYKYDKKGFPEDLNEYNLMPNGQEYYIKCYELNSKYVGNDDIRYKEVRSSEHDDGRTRPDADHMGNIFELNPYYRGLYCELPDVDLMELRLAKDYSLIYYDKTYVTSNIDPNRFKDIYTTNREWFAQVMENKAFSYDDNMRKFNCMFITLMSIFSYMDTELDKQFNYDLLDQYDIRNMLYSYGITFLNFLPTSFQLRALKNIRSLIKGKGTDRIYDIIVKNIFGNNITQVYKYYLYRELSLDDDTIERFNNGELTFADLEPSEEDSEASRLFFIRVPYNVYDIDEYLKTHNLGINDKIDFNEITSKDSYWNIDKYDESTVKSLLLGRTFVQTKYIDVNSEVNYIPDVTGLILFFSMLHDTKNSFEIKSNSLGDKNIDLFGLFVCALYIIKMMRDINISDKIPPGTIGKNGLTISCVLATYIGYLSGDYNSLYGEKDKDKSLTMELIEKMGYKYTQPKDYEDDDKVESEFGYNYIYKGFGQHFKENFEIMKALSEGLRYAAYDDDNVTGVEFDAGEDTENPDKIKDLINEINRYMHRDALADDDPAKDPDPTLATKIIDYLGVVEESGHKYRTTAWIRTLLEKANLVINSTGLYESRTEFGNKYGLSTSPDEMTVEYYIKANYPVAYEKIYDALMGDSKIRQEMLMNIFDDIIYTLIDVELVSPPPNGKHSKLVDDVNFNTFLQDYVISYAVKLIEYFKSYTVQMHSSGAVFDLSDPGPNTIQMHDLFSVDNFRHNIIGEYIFTGKVNDGKSFDEGHIFYDMDRKNKWCNNASWEPLLDQVIIRIFRMANMKKVPYIPEGVDIGMTKLDSDVVIGFRGGMVDRNLESYQYSGNIDYDKNYYDQLADDFRSCFHTGGYNDVYENSLSMEEELFCVVTNPADNTFDRQYPLYKKGAVITSVNSPILVSDNPSGVKCYDSSINPTGLLYKYTDQNTGTSEIGIIKQHNGENIKAMTSED